MSEENTHPEGACLRFNAGKVELCYLLSFEELHRVGAYPAYLWRLGAWYRGNTAVLLIDALFAILGRLPDDKWTQLCRVSEFGARKYARGNYLKGSPWSSIVNSLLRHVFAMEAGEVNDPDSGLPHYGHIAWNCAFLLHCVLNHPEHDDRLRAPAT